MSVLRQLNLLGDQRIDVPHLRSLESSIAADFDVVAGQVQAGSRAMVVRGFTLSNFTAGTIATNISMNTAGGIVYNINASEAGTFLWVPSDRVAETLNSATNPKVDGSFTASQVNYVGIDLRRSADATTADLVQFLDANTLKENPRTVPLGRTLDYRIVIGTVPFSATSNIVPVAKVKTNSLNQVDSAPNSVQDARDILWRLGSGSDFPNQYNSFGWSEGRTEATTGTGIFTGGDKVIRSQKDWMDAVMTRLWEIGGGSNWYSPTADRNVRMVRLPSPDVFTSTSDNFEWVSGLYSANHLHWKGLKLTFDNSNTAGVYYNTVTNQTGDDAAGSAAASKTALADGECLYVDLDRTANSTVTALKSTLQALSTASIPGGRVVIAWRVGSSVYTRDAAWPVNVLLVQPATTTLVGGVRLNVAAATPATPTVPVIGFGNQVTVGDAPYALGALGVAITGIGGAGGAGIYGVTTSGSSSVGVLGQSDYGVMGKGSTTGAGVFALGPSASVAGISRDGKGLIAVGGSADKIGAYIRGGGTVGMGAYIVGGSSNSIGASINGIGTGSGVVANSDTGLAVFANSGGSVPTVSITNSGTGDGLTVSSGSSSTSITATQSGSGTAIYAHATSTGYGLSAVAVSNTAIYAGSTSGNGIAVASSSGIGIVVSSTSNNAILSTAGDISIPDGNIFKHSSSVTKSIFVPASDFQLASGFDAFPDEFFGTFISPKTSGTHTAAAKIRLPQGAVMKTVKFSSSNNDGVARDLTVSIYHHSYNAGGGFTATQVHTGAASGAVVNQPGTGGGIGTETWKDVPINTALNAPSDGYTHLYVFSETPANSFAVCISGFRITYTYTDEGPMR